MNTVPHSETPIATRQSAIADPAATPAVSGASVRASMGRRELLRHVGTFGLGAVSFGVLGLGRPHRLYPVEHPIEQPVR